MMKFDKATLKQYIPTVFLGLAAIAIIILGAISAARAQVLQHELIIENGDAAQGIPQRNTQRFAPIPLNPHPQGRFAPPSDALKPTQIGRAGVLPPAPRPQNQVAQPPEGWQDMPSLSDHGAKTVNNRLGPDLSAARASGDLRRLKQKTPSPAPDFAALSLNNKDIRTAQVQVRLKGNNAEEENLLNWRLNPLEYPIFIEKINALQEPLSGFVTGSPSGSAYNFLEVRLIGEDGTVFAPVSIYQNRVRLPEKSIPLEDSDHSLENWLLGTAKRYGQKEKISQLIEVFSYEQCKTLGHTLVDAVPRQCILPDGTTFIETHERITQKDKAITNFDACLKGGHPIVATFPRKCVAPGGRIYIEPPRL